MYNDLFLQFLYSCIYAFDKDEQRFMSLKAMVTKSGSSCVKPLLKDFLQVSIYSVHTIRVKIICKTTLILILYEKLLAVDVTDNRCTQQGESSCIVAIITH